MNTIYCPLNVHNTRTLLYFVPIEANSTISNCFHTKIKLIIIMPTLLFDVNRLIILVMNLFILEKSHFILTTQVKDSEVKIEKYETDREKQQREEIERIEEERRMTEMGDRWRERGLDMMMGGKLEIDTEDELFKVSTGGFS